MLNKLMMMFGLLAFTVCLSAQVSPLPIEIYDYHIPANAVSPIAIGMGGINLTNPADYFSSYDNPALLADNATSAFATSFLLKNPDDIDFVQAMQISSLLEDKQFSYYTLLTKNAAWSYQPVASTHISRIFGATSEYYDYKLDKLQMSIAGKDDRYGKLAGGVSVKYLTGRLVYLRERVSGISMIREAFIDDKVKGASADLGVTWEEDKYILGATAYDFLSRLWWENYDSESLQRRAAVGFQYNSDSFAFLGSVTGKISSTPETTYHLGLVKNWSWAYESSASGKTTGQSLVLRAGIFSQDFNGTENMNYTLGSGYNYNMFRVDFSMTNAGMRLKDSQFLFSVGAGIGQ
jgi:hypothetical protein